MTEQSQKLHDYTESTIKRTNELIEQYYSRLSRVFNNMGVVGMEDLAKIVEELFWKTDSRDFTSAVILHVLQKELHKRGITI